MKSQSSKIELEEFRFYKQIPPVLEYRSIKDLSIDNQIYNLLIKLIVYTALYLNFMRLV